MLYFHGSVRRALRKQSGNSWDELLCLGRNLSRVYARTHDAVPLCLSRQTCRVSYDLDARRADKHPIPASEVKMLSSLGLMVRILY